MKQVSLIFFFILFVIQNANAQKINKMNTAIKSEKHISSSILLWMRPDIPRQESMDRWKGSHARIISANKGLLEYRQIHFFENQKGLWPSIPNVETSIAKERKIDGIADVTHKNLFSIFRGKKQNNLAALDEINMFKRTILYAAMGNNSHWFQVANPNEKIGARSMVFFRIREGISEKDFQHFINDELTPTLANMGVLKELRNKVYMPWKEKQWNTPNVEHDNARAVQFEASLILGFTNKAEMEAFFNSENVKKLSDRIAIFCSAVHAYDVQETLTFVKEGKVLKEPLK